VEPVSALENTSDIPTDSPEAAAMLRTPAVVAGSLPAGQKLWVHATLPGGALPAASAAGLAMPRPTSITCGAI